MESTNATKVGYLVIAIAVFVVSCSDNSPTNSRNPSSTGQTYPIIYAPLPLGSLKTMEDSFLAANPDLCAGLNEIGFTGRRASCSIQGRGVNNSFEIDSLVELAKAFLIQNSQFTGVKDANDLKLLTWRPRQLGNGDWENISLTFNSQIYDGLAVFHSAIQVTIDSLGPTYVFGNQFPEIIIPIVMTDPGDVKEQLVGHKITWFDFGGKQREFIVEDDSFCANPIDSDSSIEFEKVIFPLRTDGGRELRVTWRVEIDGCRNDGKIGMWTLYVDVVSGELISTTQNFFTLGASPQ